MLVYFDSRDLIDIAERRSPCSLDELHGLLRERGCALALSISGVLEVAAPLLSSTARTNVMGLLNRIEELPLRYVHEARIFPLELEEALAAFAEGREYQPVRPFFDRVDEAVPLRGRPPTRLYLSYGLAEYVYDQWTTNPRAFPALDEHTEQLRGQFQAAREAETPQLPPFADVLLLHLRTNGLAEPPNAAEFASWVQKSADHCASIQLVYRVCWAMVKNVTDEPKRGDMLDLIHLQSLPYVAAQTVDRRMFGYLEQACAHLGSDFHTRAFVRADELLAWLRAA